MRLEAKTLILAIIVAASLVATICLFFFIGQVEAPAEPSIRLYYAQILFTGDLFFDRGIRYYAAKGGSNEFIFEKIHSQLLNNDLVVANLEGPITDYKSVSLGTGVGDPNNFVFTFDPSLAKTLFDENIRMVDLGNNHISNFGREGVASTKAYLSEAGVGYFGTPDGPKSAISIINEIRIAFVSYNEFSMQDNEQQATLDAIKKAKKDSDAVVVLCHWGAEYKLISSSNVQKLARQFVDAGADLIIGGHPHVIQQMEEYNGKRIYYSLGNFVFDQYGFKNCQDGLGVQVKIYKTSKRIDFKEINFYMQPNGQTIEKTE